MSEPRCPWKIRWTWGQDAQCTRPEHITGPVIISQEPGGLFSVSAPGEPEHSATLPNGVTVLTWQAGDRREFTGEWPGPCTKLAGCTLRTGHHGRCAP